MSKYFLILLFVEKLINFPFQLKQNIIELIYIFYNFFIFLLNLTNLIKELLQLLALIWVFDWIHNKFSHFFHFLQWGHYLILKNAKNNKNAECCCNYSNKINWDPIVIYHELINIFGDEMCIDLQIGHCWYNICEY